MTADDPLLAPAADLRAIRDLSDDLPEQAAHKANATLMPGGLAMVALGPVASPEAALNVVDSIEQDRWKDQHRDFTDELADNDDGWEPPLQTLRDWADPWRLKHDKPNDAPTVETETTFLLEALSWACDHEPHWADFTKDVAAARRRLEDILMDGERDSTAPIRCRECDGKLIRHADDPRTCQCPPPKPEHDHAHRHACCIACHRKHDPNNEHATHRQGGYRDEWQCDTCDKRYDLDEYRTLIAQDARDNATALNADMMAERFNVTVNTIRVWAHRGHVRKRGRDELGRVLYDVAEVKARVEAEVVDCESTAV